MILEHRDARIAMFAKLPRLGKVKTRLQPALSAEQALDIYQQLLAHGLTTLQTAALCPVELWFDGQPDKSFTSQLQRRYGPIQIRVQQGDDLGQRMHHAMQEIVQRAAKIVLIGADCPAIDRDYLATALNNLNHNTPVVLGPATDGGYVLLAAQTISLPIFDAIDWGSDRVLEQTRLRLRGAGIDWFELSELTDIDRPEDLTAARHYGIVLG
ncbi:MAG: TIGR04282 family arsenosugar biosynthesis glycosyltransferase [Pseudomonadales bacterium]